MPRTTRKSPEDVCIEYALAAALVRAQTIRLRNHPCTEASRKNFNETGETECLDDFFAAPKGPDGEFPRFAEFHERMCPNCQERLQALDDRRNARRRLGAAKRAVEASGKRLNAEASVG